MKICFQCKKEVTVDALVSRKDVCPFCGTDLRCCLNCRFHYVDSYNQCRESQAERVLDKNRSNYCEYFTFNDSSSSGKSRETNNMARKKLENLFKE